MFLDGWVGGWMGVKAVLRIAHSNQKVGRNMQQSLKLLMTYFLALQIIISCGQTLILQERTFENFICIKRPDQKSLWV
jgi:hypothetical protein